jgi:phage shock protein PspC (stress-responsive transcriptional regulator)
MKKTINVNLNGRVFTMDEDAYRLLDNYLNNLRIYFRKEEGASEIIADFEARIEELLSEKTRLGYQVITIEHVETVIARVGKPADFADKEDVEEEKQTHFTETKDVKKKFFRNVEDKMFGGVCSGIAAYFGWDVLAVRIVFIILLFATSFWIVPFYLAAWIFFPGAFTAEQKLRMYGKPITVENIGKTVAAETEPVASGKQRGCLAGFIDLFVGLVKVLLIGLGFLLGIPLLFALFIVIIVLFAFLLGIGGGLLGIGGGLMGVAPALLFAGQPVLSLIALLFVIGIPIVALIYAIIAYFARWKPLHRSVQWIFLTIWIVAFVLCLISGSRISKTNLFNNINNWSYTSDYHVIRGNGILAEKTFVLNEPVTNVRMGQNLYANLQVEQIQSDTASIVINGDENLIDLVRYDLHDNQLVLSSSNPIRSENNLIILLRTNDLKSIRSDVLGNIQMNHAFTGNELEVRMTGPGTFRADSLFVQSLAVRSDGVGAIHLAGRSNNARFNLSGAGKIDALELLSDTIYASVNGVGSIQCNPIEYLEGRLNGVGKITYKEEPKTKNVTSSGVGKIGKE